MKIYRKISFRVIFLLTVLLCSAINTYSKYSDQPTYWIELTANSMNELNSLNSDTDPFGDDQISHINDLFSVIELSYKIPTPQNYFLGIKVCQSIWQPPKIS
jgi:hypothetical protein